MSDTKSKPEFTFRALNDEAYEQAGLEPLPFPIRKSQEEFGFHSAPINLDFLLQELENYTAYHPEKLGIYRRNIETLSMTHATNQINMGNAKGALKSLGYGLRANPRNHSLRLHQAIALQVTGQNDLAVIEYEAVLDAMPYALDPTIRAMAAKAYAAVGREEEGFMVLDALAETAFNDSNLNDLRNSLANRIRRKSDTTIFCANCGAKLRHDNTFCTQCGTKI